MLTERQYLKKKPIPKQEFRIKESAILCCLSTPIVIERAWPQLFPLFVNKNSHLQKEFLKKKGVIVFSQTWDTIKVKIKLYCTIDGIHKVIEAQYSGTPHEKNTSSICVYLSLSSLSEHLLLNQAQGSIPKQTWTFLMAFALNYRTPPLMALISIHFFIPLFSFASIPHICHEPMSKARVNFFWPV